MGKKKSSARGAASSSASASSAEAQSTLKTASDALQRLLSAPPLSSIPEKRRGLMRILAEPEINLLALRAIEPDATYRKEVEEEKVLWAITSLLAARSRASLDEKDAPREFVAAFGHVLGHVLWSSHRRLGGCDRVAPPVALPSTDEGASSDGDSGDEAESPPGAPDAALLSRLEALEARVKAMVPDGPGADPLAVIDASPVAAELNSAAVLLRASKRCRRAACRLLSTRAMLRFTRAKRRSAPGSAQLSDEILEIQIDAALIAALAGGWHKVTDAYLARGAAGLLRPSLAEAVADLSSSIGVAAQGRGQKWSGMLGAGTHSTDLAHALLERARHGSAALLGR